MTGRELLCGHWLLVVEDDYFLATDTMRALRGAGAHVIGPCATENAARQEIQRKRPSAAVIDINLGDGPSFDLARTLKELSVPLVFVTGYDQVAIPDDFAGVVRFQKPVELRDMVKALARMLESTV
jgi:DNA-binding response OmpR family regulator